MSLRKDRIEKQGKRKGMMRFALLALATLLVMGILYQIGTNMQRAIVRFNRDIKVVEYGTLEDRFGGPAVIMNREILLTSAENGRFENMVKEKEKVARGALLGYIISDQGRTPVRAANSGIFMRQTDGLEETFSEFDIQAVNGDTFTLKTYSGANDALQVIPAGTAFGKIVDSLQPTRILVKLPGEEFNLELKTRHQVKLFQGEISLGKAYVLETKRDPDASYVLLELDRFSEDLLGQRNTEIEVVFNSYSGYLVADKAVVEKSGKKGIYCANGEEIYFKPIELIKIKDGLAVVDGLEVNDIVVNNPPAEDTLNTNR